MCYSASDPVCTHGHTQILLCPVLGVFCDATTTQRNDNDANYSQIIAGHEVSLIVSCVVAKHADETAYYSILYSIEHILLCYAQYANGEFCVCFLLSLTRGKENASHSRREESLAKPY